MLRDKVVWVTGSSRGIGAAVARLFARQGAKVAIHGRDRAALARVRAEIDAESSTSVIEVIGDVTNSSEVDAMRRQIERQLGPIEILVANAGGTHSLGELEATTEDEWRASIDGNLTATFLTLKSVLPGMKERRAGNLITISSAAGHRANARSPLAYAAAKAGIEILTKALAARVGPYNIRVNCIAPETILTERNVERIPDSQRAALAQAHPIQRLGTPDDVARTAVFLASDDAGWISGVVIDVAGGAV